MDWTFPLMLVTVAVSFVFAWVLLRPYDDEYGDEPEEMSK